MCKRNRPKFKVGDILEDFTKSFRHQDHTYEIYHWLVVELKYVEHMQAKVRAVKKRVRRSIKKLERKVMGSRNKKSGWLYTLKLLKSTAKDNDQAEIWTSRFQTIDKVLCFKKVG